MKKTLLLITLFAFTMHCHAQTVTDIEGNIYNTVTIGTQIWMKENLKTTKYNDNTSIPQVTSAGATWGNLTTPAYRWTQSEYPSYNANYGVLYNWYTINTTRLCPTGWHVPSDAEWTSLVIFLGGEDVAGGKLKEAGTSHWIGTNTGTDNSSGFTALPGGACDLNGDISQGADGNWWSSTANNNNESWLRGLVFIDVKVARSTINKKIGNSVRCLKDDVTAVTASIVFDERYIYPNPSYDRLYIRNNNASETYVTIYNMQGKQVIHMKMDTNSINISSLSKGVYLVKFITSGSTFVNKFIKE